MLENGRKGFRAIELQRSPLSGNIRRGRRYLSFIQCRIHSSSGVIATLPKLKFPIHLRSNPVYFTALALDNEIGNFQVGKSFDALVVNLASSFSPVDVFPGNDIIELVQKFIMLGDDRNVVSVFVNGQVVKSLQK